MTSFSSLNRVTDSLLGQQLLRNIQGSLRGLAEGERSISSGRRFARPSDAPLSVRRIIAWQRIVERNQTFTSTISLASSRLATTESSLDEINNLIIRAREIGLSQLNSTATNDTRVNAAVEVSNLLDESLTLANRQFGENQREALSGVSIDEEAISLIKFQRAYQGAARFLSVVDRLLETLINSV